MSLKNINVFFCLLFLLINVKSKSFISFIFPYSLTLSNQNIFVIHRYGITVCDSYLTKVLEEIIVFPEDEQINTEDALSKITTASENGYIFCIINDKIYIFNDTGTLLYQSTEKILETGFSSDYYSISPIAEQNNNYYYIIGFIDNNKIHFYCYEYNIRYKTNIKKYSLKNYNNDYGSIQNKGLSCNYMYHTLKEFVLACFFIITRNGYYYITIDYFTIGLTSMSLSSIFSNYHQDFYNTKCIKTALSPDYSKVLLGAFDIDGTARFFIYDININYNINYERIESKYLINDKCRTKYYGLKVYYYPDKEEYIFSCLEAQGMVIEYFDNTFRNYNYSFKYLECEEIYGNSILYLTSKNNYYLISDAVCNSKKISLNLLIGDIIEEEKEEEEEEEEEIEEEKEEEIKEEIEEEHEKDLEEEIKEENEEEIEEVFKEEIKEEIEEEKEDEIEEEKERIEKTKCENLEKCEICSEDSLIKELCIKCNNIEGYYYINNNNFYNEYIDCANEETKPHNFYFNKEKQEYDICYANCAECDYSGDWKENNCTLCEQGYTFISDYINSTNCYPKCQNYYYIKYNQYKCTNDAYCPYDYSLEILEKKKCIDKCENDNLFKYQYSAKCFKQCPNNTINNDNDYLCKDENTDYCSLTENEWNYLQDNITDNEIEIMAKNYAREFYYTNNHISIFLNKIYNITFYKNSECISALSLSLPEIDLQDCYTKIKSNCLINDNLVLAIITKKVDGINYPKMVTFSIYEPDLGEKIPYNNICINETITIKKDLLQQVDEAKINMDLFFFFTRQNIDVFNHLDAFYTDICFDFVNPINKDIALKDRLLLCFPNITLCEKGCNIKGINLTTFKAICECKLNNILGNNMLEDNLLFQLQFGDLEDMISKTNIEIIKCYKKAFKSKYFINSFGNFIILLFIIIQIIMIFLYFYKSSFLMRKYIFHLKANFISFYKSQKSLEENDNIEKNFEEKLFAPPKKGNLINKIKDEFNEDNNQTRIKKRNASFHRKKKVKINVQQNSDFHKSTQTKTVLNKKKKNKKSSKSLDKKFLNIDKNTSKELETSNKIFSNERYPKSLSFVNKIDSNILDYLATDLNDMDYDDAIRRDKRKFCEYFYERLKMNQFILNTFINEDKLKPRTIKIILFILVIDLYLFINALFINEDYVSEIFHLTKEERFFSFVPRSYDRFFYATIVGVILNFILDFFFIQNIIIILEYEIVNIIKDLQKRFIYFIILSFIITVFTWYYLLCFNTIYPHMKEEWIKSSIIIIIGMQILSILVYLLEAIIRFVSFKCESEKLFKLSLILS